MSKPYRRLGRYVGLGERTVLEEERSGRPIWLWLRLVLLGRWRAIVATLSGGEGVALVTEVLQGAYALLRAPEEAMAAALGPVLERIDAPTLRDAIRRADGTVMLVLAGELVTRGEPLEEAWREALAKPLVHQDTIVAARRLLRGLDGEARRELFARGRGRDPRGARRLRRAPARGAAHARAERRAQRGHPSLDRGPLSAHARGAIGAFERRPHATKRASAARRALNGVLAASPRERWKRIAAPMRTAQPSAASTVRPGLMRELDGKSRPRPPRAERRSGSWSLSCTCALAGISQRMLTTTLRGLERDGLVKRTVYPTNPPQVDYALTKLGRTLLEPVRAPRDDRELHFFQPRPENIRVRARGTGEFPRNPRWLVACFCERDALEEQRAPGRRLDRTDQRAAHPRDRSDT